MIKIESRFLKALIFIAVGGIVYWTVDGLLGLPAYTSAKVMVVTKSIMLPVLMISALYVVVRVLDIDREDIFALAIFMVAGIWTFSPLFILIISMFTKHGLLAFKNTVWLFIAFPITAIEVSTFSGGLWGLIISSMGVPVAATFLSRERKQ